MLIEDGSRSLEGRSILASISVSAPKKRQLVVGRTAFDIIEHMFLAYDSLNDMKTSIYSPSLSVMMHSSSLSVMMHSPSLSVMMHSSSLSVMMHSSSLSVMMHSSSLSVMMHSSSLS